MSQKYYCPYCNHEYDEDRFRNFTKERDIRLSCSNCGKWFLLNVVVIIDYKLKKQCEWNGEKHQWRDIGNKCVKCNVCDYIELKKNTRV